MLQVEVTPEAEKDLLDIWIYIAFDQPDNADRYLDKLQSQIQTLAAYPNLGKDRPDLAPGLKSFPYERYGLYYLITDTSLILVRMLSSALDIDHQDFGGLREV